MTEIIRDYPPIYEILRQRFQIRKGTIYSWGDRIYNPDGMKIGAELMAHEAVHGSRQGSTEASIRAWWDRYIDDHSFRLSEEIEAHRAEYGWWLENGNRQQKRAALKQVAERLSGPLYGHMLTSQEAQGILWRAFNGVRHEHPQTAS